MKNWKTRFEDKILWRGLDYYESNAVRIYNYSNTHVHAQVAGTNIYDVSIYFSDSRITSMHCNCPYYDNCKHLAATLYHIEEHPELLQSGDFTDLISSCTYEELVEFLSSEIMKSPDLANRLKLFKNNEIDEEHYFNKLKVSFSSSSDILRFMNEDMDELIEFKQYDLLFTLCKLVVDHVNDELKYGYCDMFEDVIYKLDDITTLLRDVDDAHEGICDFLEYAITTSEDYMILDVLTDAMSRNGDMSRLYDDESFDFEEDDDNG